MLTRALPLLAVAFALAGCGTSESRTMHVFHVRPEGQLSSSELERSATILQKRLDAVGAGGNATRSGDEIRVRFPAKTLPPYLLDKSTLEFFDLEPSMVSGPSESRPAARTGTVVVTCSAIEDDCPKVLSTGRDYYYLFKTPPALTGADLQGKATKVNKDPSTGNPSVQIAFTSEGARKFQDVTRKEAQRGAAGQPNQHLAVVFDREIVSYPSVSPTEYPNGINGSDGVEITGGSSLDEANALATVLRAGSLPAAFHVVGR